MWDSHFHGTPSKVIVEEISSENNSDKTFKVGQIYSHPLYVYKLEISKIEAYKGESYSYRNASIFVKPCFFNRENEIVKLDEYEMTTEELNADKWWIESEK
ncbi:MULTISPECIES: hypothetical protein [Bacillus]|jgi:hypothetical protein|uniref:Uncharacterized protein n=7 Tax=Bacillus cereus group TaxID=86661 RepID=A0A6I6YVZ3_9BACI|nr:MULTISPECIES: hypothetical protein [Bacillus]ACI30413.1 conserved hypothetical protein [Bacillus cereus H3081.97]ACJ82721.1 conserved hypothetical protein [Bacillus cereus AH187]EEK45153.1 hypothetical protein bcere0001_17880 [Bacillus cereus m1293]EEK79634.1 hypothetical protein bcere0009_14570 [Bacillus cereus R309803]EEK97498.1 hypothetical protein bcere0013_53360 [Bacillus cereus BDRD-ST26]EEL79024.1 hypothetical protein bcere0028_53340 [Bacillus cereus AH1271]EEL94405.1 hypothetical 